MSGALGTAADNDQYTFPLNAGDTVYGSLDLDLDLDLDPDPDPDPERDGDGNGQLISLATTPAAQPASRAGAARG